MKKMVIKGVLSVVLTLLFMCFIPAHVYAAETPINPKFDYRYYADTYADIKATFGYDQNALWNHYVEHGQYEKRSCYKGDAGGTITTGNANQNVAITAQASMANIEVDEFNRLMLDRINTYRASRGLSPLENRGELFVVGEARLLETTTKWGHTRPNGTSFKTIYQELGYEGVFPRVGENLACIGTEWDFSVDGDANAYVDKIFKMYLKSSAHKKNMLKSYWKYYGGAFQTNYNGKCYNIQVFAN